MKKLFLMSAVGLAGCAPGMADPGDLKPPAPWMMRQVCALPKPVADDGDPVARVNYETQVRKCAAARGDQARGLQRYARAITKK
jgi:hypothetical protein